MFTFPVTPRYLEVDQQGVVFNMWYLGWFDDAWAAFMASLGRSYPRMLADGDDVMLVRTELDWHAGVRFGQDVVIGVAVEHLGRTSFTVRFEVRRGEETTARARTVYVMVGTDGSGPRAVPPDLRAALAAHLVPAPPAVSDRSR